MDSVHKLNEKIGTLQQKVETGKDQLQVPGRREGGKNERMREGLGRGGWVCVCGEGS